MSIPKYSEYKSTEYGWLGSIPLQWRWLYLSQSSVEQDIKNTGNAVSNVLSLSYGQIIRKKNIDFGLSPKDYGTYQIVDNGNIILRLTDLQNDHKSLRTGLVRERGIITSAYVCLRPFENPAYLQYLLHSYDTQKYFYGLGGGVRQSIGYKDIRYIKIPLPPRDEQDQIVRYLDWKVSQINKFINAKKRQIALLQEQKQTEICTTVFRNHRHWESKRIKYLFALRDERNHLPSSDVRLLSLYAALGVFPTDEIEKTTGNKSTTVENYKRVYAGDIVVNIILCWQGAIGLSNYDGVTSPAYDVYVPLTNEVYANFYHYLFRTKKFGDECFKVGHGIMAMRWRVYSDEFSSIRVPVPPIVEQHEIVTYLDEQCGRIDRVITELNNEITLFTEYRTRLISDVVTGKLDVRRIVVPEYEAVDEPADEDPTDDDTMMGTEE